MSAPDPVSLVPVGFAAGATIGTTLIRPTFADGKGPWTEISPAIDGPWSGFWLQFTTTAYFQVLIDVGIGAAGVEEALVSDLYFPLQQGPRAFTCWLPVSVPAGARVSARVQVSAIDQTRDTWVSLIGARPTRAGHRGYRAATGLAININTTKGVLVTSGLDPNTAGAWVELVAALPADVGAIMILPGSQYENGVPYDDRHRLEIGVGVGGDEAVLLPDLACSQDSMTDEKWPDTIGPFSVSLSAGTRLSARLRSVTSEGTLSVGLLCFPA